MDDQGGYRRKVPMSPTAFSRKARGKQLPGSRCACVRKLTGAVGWLWIEKKVMILVAVLFEPCYDKGIIYFRDFIIRNM